ncbi:MAG: hypothetical protein AABW79_00460 [Nanoarchaeota archaeon]
MPLGYDFGERMKESCFGLSERPVISWSAPSEEPIPDRAWNVSITRAIRHVCGGARSVEPLSDEALRVALTNRSYCWPT